MGEANADGLGMTLWECVVYYDDQGSSGASTLA